MALFCKQCGAQLGEGAKFCPGCGAVVEAAPPPQYGQAAPPPQYGQAAPPPQYGQAAPPPQYGQAAAPKKGLSKKLLLIIIIAAVAVAAVLILVNVLGNQDEPKPQEPPAPPVVTGDDEDYTDEDDTNTDDDVTGSDPDPGPDPIDTDDDAGGYQEGMTAENPSVFDFSDLNGEDFPRGMWSVNQLATMYGAPEEIKADYMADYGIVFVRSVHKNLSVSFAPDSAESFSFYNEGMDDGLYTLNESDKDIEFQILSVRVQSASANLPYDILIGQSTKAQIVAAYGEYPAFLYQDEEYGTDEMIYNYAYYDEHGGLIDDYGEGYTGGITYNFGENGVLLHVDVQWEYFDL